MPDGEIFSSGSRLLTRAGSAARAGSRPYRTDWRELARALRLPPQHRARRAAVVFAADKKWRPLMELGGLDVENSLFAVGCGSSRLLYDERERTRLVQESQL